jgi:HAD superfamily 5'-nucleotidase-like hydrolase
MIGRGGVDSILKYQAIGFDMDHTLVRYKMRSLIGIVYECTAIYLVSKKGYPQEIFPLGEEDAHEKYRMYFRAVFDLRNGNLLKMGANSMIMRGYHGFQRLTSAEIIESYGSMPVVPGYNILSTSSKDFCNLHEYYQASQVPIIAQIVGLKSQGDFPMLNRKDFNEIMEDIKSANSYNYMIENQDRFKAQEYRGYFYPKFLTKPRNFLYKWSDELKEKLRALKQKGIQLFVVSNSAYPVADYIMREAVGSDWLDYFDYVVYSANKPVFFDRSTSPPSFINLAGEPLTSFADFMLKPRKGEEKVLQGGHASHINSYMRDRVGKEFKCLFFGDTIVSDCVYAFDAENEQHWDIAMIMEELQELEHGYRDKEYFNYWRYWGSALQDKNLRSGVDKTNIFDFADNVAHRSFSLLDSPEALEFLSID